MKGLRGLDDGQPEEAERVLLGLVRERPQWPEAWLALRGARWAMRRVADADATGAEWQRASPAQAGIARIAMARPLSSRGLPFDVRDLLRLRGRAEALIDVTRPEDLVTGAADACYTIHPGGLPVRHDPVICLAPDSSDRIEVETETEPSFVAVLQNAAIAGRGLVVTQRNEVIRETLAVQVRKHGVSLGSRHVRLLPGRHLLDGSVPLQIHDGAALLMAGPTDRSFGDWIWKYPPRLAMAKDVGLDVPLVVSSRLPTRHEELLELLGVDRSRLVRHDPRGLSLFRTLYVTSWPTNDRMRPMQHWNRVYDGLARRAMEAWTERADRGMRARPLLYLSRRDIPSRVLVNEAEVIGAFRRRGFEVLQPEQMTWRDVLTAFACPAVVAGPYGSAWRNLAFSYHKPLGLVLMPPADRVFMRGTALWLAEMGIRFGHVPGRALAVSEGAPPQTGEWTIDVAHVEREIDRVLALAKR